MSEKMVKYKETNMENRSFSTLEIGEFYEVILWEHVLLLSKENNHTCIL